MVPQHDRMVLRPMPDANTRVSALLSGQVDLVEALPPDAVPTVKGAGMQVTTNVYPHIWPYMVSHLKSSPFSDIRIRKAANLAIDRENLTKFLGGLAVPAQGNGDSGPSVVRQPVVQGQVRPGRRAEVHVGRGLQQEQPRQGQRDDVGGGFRPDATVAHERVHPGKLPRGGHQHVALDRGLGSAAVAALRGSRRRPQQGRRRHQLQLVDPVPGVRPHRPDVSQREPRQGLQLGPLRGQEGGPACVERPGRVRDGGTEQAVSASCTPTWWTTRCGCGSCTT